eukprot:3233691-Pyramimonas_sp.AAC.1
MPGGRPGVVSDGRVANGAPSPGRSNGVCEQGELSCRRTSQTCLVDGRGQGKRLRLRRLNHSEAARGSKAHHPVHHGEGPKTPEARPLHQLHEGRRLMHC